MKLEAGGEHTVVREGGWKVVASGRSHTLTLLLPPSHHPPQRSAFAQKVYHRVEEARGDSGGLVHP